MAKKGIVLLIFQVLAYVLLTIWAWTTPYEMLLKSVTAFAIYIFVSSCWRFR